MVKSKLFEKQIEKIKKQAFEIEILRQNITTLERKLMTHYESTLNTDIITATTEMLLSNDKDDVQLAMELLSNTEPYSVEQVYSRVVLKKCFEISTKVEESWAIKINGDYVKSKGAQKRNTYSSKDNAIKAFNKMIDSRFSPTAAHSAYEYILEPGNERHKNNNTILMEFLHRNKSGNDLKKLFLKYNTIEYIKL